MKILFALLLLIGSAQAQLIAVGVRSSTLGATGTFTLVQAKRNTSCGSSTTCAITITTTAVNNLLYFEAYAANQVALVSVNKGGTLVVPTSCHGFQAAEAWSCGYILPSGTSAATTPITLTFSGSTGSYGGATMWELHPSANYANVGLEATGFKFVGSSSTPVGPAFTVTGTGAAALHTAGGVASESSVAAPFTGNFSGAIGVASNMSSTGSGPTWTMASSTDTALEGGIFSWNPTACDDYIYMDQSGGSNGANPTATTITNSTYGTSVWSKVGALNPLTWVTDTTGPNMQSAIRPCGSGVTRDGTMNLTLHWDLSVDATSNYFYYPFPSMTSSASIGYWWKTDLAHTDLTHYITAMPMYNGTGTDTLALMCNSGACYPETFSDPNGNPLSCSGSSCSGSNRFNYTENTWYWVTHQMNKYVSGATHQVISIYSNATPPVLLARMEKAAASSSPHNPNELHYEIGDDIGTSDHSVDIRGLKINLNGTFPLLP